MDINELIVNSIESALSNLHTSTIAKIERVNQNTIDVQPVFRRLVDGREIKLPMFKDVLLINLIGGSSYIHMPVKAGDYVIMFFTERCIEGWFSGQDDAVPSEYRMHDYSDGFAICGINNSSNLLDIPSVIQITGEKNHDGDSTQTGDRTHNGELLQNGNEKKNGNLVINGNLTINNSSGGSAQLNNTVLTITNGDVIADGISLKNHTHTGDSGGTTSPPN